MADQPHISMKPGFSMQEHLKLHSNLDDSVEFTTADISKLKEEGNAKLKAGDHQGAIEAYSRGICVFQENGSQVPAGMTGRDIAALYGNRAAVFLSQNKFQEALDDAVISVLNDEHWYKGHARVGRAHRKLGNLEISFHALLDALKCTKTQSNDIKVEIIMELTQTYSMLPRNKFPLEAKIPETPITDELLWYRAAYSFIEKDCWDEAHVAYLQACTNMPMEAKFPVSLKPLCEIEKADLHPWVLQIIHYFLICHSNHQEISCYPGDTYFHAVAYLTIKAGSSKNERSLSLLQYILDTFVLPKNEQDLLDKDGNTAFHVVLREPCQDNKLRYDIMMLLAEAPVNPYIKNLEGKTVQDVAYNIHSLKVDLLFIEEKYSLLKKYYDKDPEARKRKMLPKVNDIEPKQMEALAQETKRSVRLENQDEQRSPQERNQVEGHGTRPAAEQFPCKCDKLFKDSELDFSLGDMDDGYQKLVWVLEFKILSMQHSRHVDKVISIITNKLGESFSPEIPDTLTALSENMYKRVIEGLIQGKKWRQMNTAAQTYQSKNGSDKMKNFATCVDLVELVEDTSFRTAEDVKLQIINTVLDSGASLGKEDGRRAVKAAISEGHFKVVTELLKRGASPSALSLAVGDTPIHAALTIGLEKDNGSYINTFFCR